MKTIITKSKSGHYTVTVYQFGKSLPIAKHQKLNSLQKAREIASEYKTNV